MEARELTFFSARSCCWAGQSCSLPAGVDVEASTMDAVVPSSDDLTSARGTSVIVKGCWQMKHDVDDDDDDDDDGDDDDGRSVLC
jgi:hypothetical protein